MKFFIAFACLLAVAVANENANVVRSESEVNPESFKTIVELDNGSSFKQEGQLINDNWSVNGDFKYTSPEGEEIALQYVADENGYKPDPNSPLLPTPPPIPAEILKAIEYINAHPATQ